MIVVDQLQTLFENNQRLGRFNREGYRKFFARETACNYFFKILMRIDSGNRSSLSTATHWRI
jgi:hypothetical protein